AAQTQHRPCPADEDGKAIAEADQVVDVDEAPHQPREVAGDLHEAEVGRRGAAADRGHRAKIEVAKGAGRGLAPEAAGNQLAEVMALLFGDRCESGQVALATPDGRGVAGDEDLWMSR